MDQGHTLLVTPSCGRGCGKLRFRVQCLAKVHYNVKTSGEVIITETNAILQWPAALPMLAAELHSLLEQEEKWENII